MPSCSKENLDCQNSILKKENYSKKFTKTFFKKKIRSKWYQLKQMYKIIFLLLLIMSNFTEILSHYYASYNNILTASKETSKSKDYQEYIHLSSSIDSLKIFRQKKGNFITNNCI